MERNAQTQNPGPPQDPGPQHPSQDPGPQGAFEGLPPWPHDEEVDYQLIEGLLGPWDVQEESEEERGGEADFAGPPLSSAT